MELRVVPLLADELVAPAALGLPFRLRRRDVASMPVPLTVATAPIRTNEKEITNCFIPTRTDANESASCVLSSGATAIEQKRFKAGEICVLSSVRGGVRRRTCSDLGPLPAA
jgi:hypothetical protein